MSLWKRPQPHFSRVQVPPFSRRELDPLRAEHVEKTFLTSLQMTLDFISRMLTVCLIEGLIQQIPKVVFFRSPGNKDLDLTFNRSSIIFLLPINPTQITNTSCNSDPVMMRLTWIGILCSYFSTVHCCIGAPYTTPRPDIIPV